MAAEAGALPTFALDPVGSTGKSNYDRPVSQAADVWSRSLMHVSATLGDWAEQSARHDAEQAGAMAGLDPNYRGEGGPFLQNAAFHAAATKTYERQLDTKLHVAQEDALNEWTRLPEDQRSPKALQGLLDQRKSAIDKADVFDSVRPQFETTWNRLSASSLAAADKDFYQRTLDQAKAATLANASAVSDTAHRVASLSTSTDAEIAGQIATHDKLMDDAVNQSQISAPEAEIRKEKFRQSVLSTRTLSTFENLPQTDRPAALDRFKGSYGGDYYAQLRQAESGGNDAAKANGSSAQGRYQFTQDTWRDLARAHPDLGLTPEGRNDPGQQEKAVRAFTADNARLLRGAGYDASNANLRMAHFMGADGAVKFLDAMKKNPDASAAALFPKAADANPRIFNGRSLKDVYALQTKGFSGSNQTAGLSNDSYDWLVGKMEQRVQADAHQASVARTSALHEITAAKRQIADGYDVTPDQWSKLSSAYAGSPDAETRAAFDQAARVRGMIAGFTGKPPQQVEAQIASMQAGFKDGGTPQEREMVADASKWLDAYRKDIAKDPVQRYARDFGSAVGALDFASPQALTASLSARLPVAEQAAKAYNLPAPRFLLESEKSALKTLAANGGPQMVQAAGAMMKALGPRGADLLKEIGGDDAPAFAQAARVSAWGGEKGFLDDFAEWHRLSSDPATRKAMALPDQKAATPILDKAIGGSLYALPELAAAARTSALQTFELRAFRNGWDKSLDDSAATSALARATQEALGATFVGDTQYGGVATRRVGWWGKQSLLAPGNLRADRLGDVIASLNDADLKSLPAQPLYADNRPAGVDAVHSGHFLSVGRGKYEVYDRDPLSKDAVPLRDASGKPWVLDLNVLGERLRARTPGAWR